MQAVSRKRAAALRRSPRSIDLSYSMKHVSFLAIVSLALSAIALQPGSDRAATTAEISRNAKAEMNMKVSGSVSAILAHKKASTVWSIGPKAIVIDAIQLMDEKNVGALPVVDNGTLVRILSSLNFDTHKENVRKNKEKYCL